MLKKIIIITIKILLLIVLLNFENVIGMPFMYVMLSLLWIESIESEWRIALVTVLSIFLAIIYSMSFTLSLIFLALAGILYVFGEKIIVNKHFRLVISSVLVMILMLVFYKFSWGLGVVLQVMIEMSIFWLIQKINKKKYYEY